MNSGFHLLLSSFDGSDFLSFLSQTRCLSIAQSELRKVSFHERFDHLIIVMPMFQNLRNPGNLVSQHCAGLRLFSLFFLVDYRLPLLSLHHAADIVNRSGSSPDRRSSESSLRSSAAKVRSLPLFWLSSATDHSSVATGEMLDFDKRMELFRSKL